VPSQVLQYDPEQAEVKAQYKRLKNMVKMLETVTAHPSPCVHLLQMESRLPPLRRRFRRVSALSASSSMRQHRDPLPP
jgi:hypothetical protein